MFFSLFRIKLCGGLINVFFCILGSKLVITTTLDDLNMIDTPLCFYWYYWYYNTYIDVKWI